MRTSDAGRNDRDHDGRRYAHVRSGSSIWSTGNDSQQRTTRLHPSPRRSARNWRVSAPVITKSPGASAHIGDSHSDGDHLAIRWPEHGRRCHHAADTLRGRGGLPSPSPWPGSRHRHTPSGRTCRCPSPARGTSVRDLRHTSSLGLTTDTPRRTGPEAPWICYRRVSPRRGTTHSPERSDRVRRSLSAPDH